MRPTPARSEPRTKIGVTAAVAMFERLGVLVCAMTVRRWCGRGRLAAIRPGGFWLIDPASVEQVAQAEQVAQHAA